MNEKSIFLHTPPGSKPFYKDEVLFRDVIEKKLSDFFEKWSFFPIETPIIDYFDVYSPFLSEKDKKGSVKFVNTDGDLIVLRNDITLFAAKLIASRFADKDETLKYYYSDSIIRSYDKDTPKEYYQMGCEIVGSSFSNEEIEMLIILLESTKLLGLKDSILHIGDISFYHTLLLPYIKEEDLNILLKYIRLRDKVKVKDCLSSMDIPQDVKDDCLKVAFFIGSVEELKSLQLSDKGKKSLANIIRITSTLSGLGYDDKFLINLSELSEFDFYSGIIFHLYAANIEKPLVSGGRYDKLFKGLGRNKTAVGFSYWLYPLEKLINADLYKFKTGEEVKITDKNLISTFKNIISKVNNDEQVSVIYE